VAWYAGAVSVIVLLILCAAGYALWTTTGLSDSTERLVTSEETVVRSMTTESRMLRPLTNPAAAWPATDADAESNRENVIIVTLDGDPGSAMFNASSNVKLSGVTMILRPPESSPGEPRKTATGNPVLIDVVDGSIELRGCRIRSPVPVTVIQTAGNTRVTLTDCQIDIPAGVLLHETGGGTSLTLQNSRLRTATLVSIDQARSSATPEELRAAPQPVTDIVVEESVLHWKTSLVNLQGLPACLNGASGVGPGPRMEWIQSTLHWSGATAIYIPVSATGRQTTTDAADLISESQSAPAATAWLTVRGRVPVNLDVNTSSEWLTLLDVRGTREL